MTLTTRQLYLSAFAVMTLLWLVYFISTGMVANVLHSWNVLPKTDAVTELYFTDHAALPEYYKPGELRAVAFTVAAARGVVSDYDYVIVADTKSGRTVLKKGSMTVEGKKDIKETVRLPSVRERLRVRVVISQKEALSENATDKTIHYWVRPS